MYAVVPCEDICPPAPPPPDVHAGGDSWMRAVLAPGKASWVWFSGGDIGLSCPS